MMIVLDLFQLYIYFDSLGISGEILFSGGECI